MAVSTDATEPPCARCVPDLEPKMRDVTELVSRIGIDQVWLALVDDSEARVGITSRDGKILWANAIAQRRHRERSKGKLVGKNVFDLVPERIGYELRAAKERALRTGDPVHVETVINGVQTRLTYRAFGSSEEPGFLVVARDMAQPLQDDTCRSDHQPLVRTKARDLGPLESLTRRELDILALIGEHLSAQDIADRLGRSPKTIEWHRVSIGRKLGVRTRGELAQIAQRAGLVRTPGEGESPNGEVKSS